MQYRGYGLILPGETVPALYAWRTPLGWETSPAPSDISNDGADWLIFVPGTDVLTLEISLPARNDREARKAAPFAVEDEVAQPLDTVHVAISKPGASGTGRQASICSHERMLSWTRALSDTGIAEASLTPMQAVLPDHDCVIDARWLLLARQGERAFALDADTPPALLGGLLKRADTEIHGEALAERLSLQAAGPALDDPRSLLLQLADWAEAREAPLADLRQGPYATSAAFDLSSVMRWRFAAALVACVFAVWIGSVLLETRALDNRAEALRAETRTRLAQALPETDGNMDAALASLRAAGPVDGPSLPPATALALLYEALGELQGTVVQSLRYDAAAGELSATLSFRDFSGADALRSKLTREGLDVSAGDARQSGDRVVGEVTLRMAR